MIFDDLIKLVTLKNAPKIRTDSRKVQPGDIFIAINGTSFDGHDFLEQAVSAGAKYIVTQKLFDTKNADVIIVENSAIAAAILAQAACGNPASKLINLAVTGTNGKTTIAFLVRAMIQAAGQKCGLISTVIYDTTKNCVPSELTTPDCFVIAKAQKEMVENGAKYMVIEASSHALTQDRLAGVNFKGAAFTNLTGDHLDYHKTEENYLAAKTLLFQSLKDGAVAILNKQSPQSQLIAQKTTAPIQYYAVDEPADLSATIESLDINKTVFTLKYKGQRKKITTPLIGKHNISNILAAAGLCLAGGIDLQTIALAAATMRQIPGRLEKINWPGDFTVIVDYSHTDDALKTALATVKPLCKGRLIVVFGCGGDRDRTKRPRMAKVAESLADIIIVTSDNPRTEVPAAIVGEIATGFENPSSDSIIFEVERKDAIALAIKMALKDDIVLIAGKGHEDYQIIGTKKIHFSDVEIAKQCMEARL